MKVLFLGLLSLSIGFFSSAQKTLVSKRSSNKWKDDFKIFKNTLEEGHPGLFRYRSKTEMDAMFKAAESSLSRSNDKKEFQLLVSRVVNKIGCGHTKVLPSQADLDSFEKAPTIMPFQAYYVDGNLYVQKNYSHLQDSELLGAQIISVNGHSTEDFLEQYLAIASSDGANLTNKYARLQDNRHFTRCFYYLYGFAKSYVVKYIPYKNRAVKKATLEGLSYDRFSRIKSQIDTPLQFNMNVENKTAYLIVKSFDKSYLKTQRFDFAQFIKNAFKKIDSNDIQNLILDLRDNGGGSDDYGRVLFSYFIKEDFKYYDSLIMNRDSFYFFKYTQMAGMKPPSDMLRKNSEGTFDIIKYSNYGMQKPSSPLFSGNLYVLINGGSFSTTSECLSMLHFKTKAKFIGEESGGGYYGSNGGVVAELTLPNSGIRVYIPLVKYVMAVTGYRYKDRGLLPDYQLIPTVTDKITQRDSQLELAYKLIAEANLE